MRMARISACRLSTGICPFSTCGKADVYHRGIIRLRARLSCQVDPDRVALWWSDDLALRLSGLAAQTLADAKLLDMKKLEPHRKINWLETRTQLTLFQQARKSTTRADQSLTRSAEVEWRSFQRLPTSMLCSAEQAVDGADPTS